MDSHKGSHRPRCWCGQVLETALLAGADDSVSCCSIACYEEVYEATQNLQSRRHEFAMLSEKVDDMHEVMYLVILKIERQILKLKAYGKRWISASSDEERSLLEGREQKSARILGRLNKSYEKLEKRARPIEQEQRDLDEELSRLKKIVGEN